MPSINRDVNAAVAAYTAATDSNRLDLQYGLIKSLEKYARKIVWLTLHESRPEIVNEAVQYVLAHLADFKAHSKFSTWFFSIVRRLCLRELQRKITQNETVFSDFKDYQVEALGTYELDGDAKIALQRIRQTLSEDENQIVEFKLQGYTHSEIGQLMGITTSAVESRWRRLCEKVRQTRKQNNKPTQKTRLTRQTPID